MDGTGNPQSFTSPGDPTRSASAAQWWLLFGVLVANKPAAITTKKLLAFLGEHWPLLTPFEILRSTVKTGTLRLQLERVRTGQYRRITAAFMAIDLRGQNNPDPGHWPLEWLEDTKGIGPKTARWFYMLCHPDARVAALDTHVLKFLGDNGVTVPKGTPPSGPIYRNLENKFIAWADKLGVKPRDLDFMAWTVYRNKGKILF